MPAPLPSRRKPGRGVRTPTLPARSSPLSEFAELYDQYFPKVFAYVYGRVQHKEASLDIVSDVFEKAFVKKQSLRSAEAFGSWLFTIARNEVASHWRKEKPAAKAMQDAAWHNELNNKPPSPEDTLLHRERVHHLVGLLRQLPPREQEIISLKFDAELTNREIAEILQHQRSERTRDDIPRAPQAAGPHGAAARGSLRHARRRPGGHAGQGH